MARKRESEDPQRGFLDVIEDRVVVTDLEGRILEVNQAVLDLRGRRREELAGRSFQDLVPDKDRERLGRFLHELLAKGSPGTIEMAGEPVRGRPLYSEIKASVVRDASGRPRKIVSVIRDVTRRKEVERRLAESEEMYRDLLDNIHEGVYKIDAAGTLLFVSAGVERIIGYAPEELVGRNFSEFIHPQDLEFIRAEFQRLAQNLLRPSEYRVVCKDGSCRWISSTSRPLFKDGTFIGITGVLIDIHERKVAQEALARQQELLQQAQKMEAIGTLAGGIAHDFNNLLMGIQGRVSLMLQDSDPKDPHHGHLQGIEEHVRSASELTRQLLGVARGGQYELRASDLNELIRRTLDMFGRTRKEIVITSRLEPRLWTVEIDRTQIEQVLLNLLVNAWQAMPGGGRLSVESRNLELRQDDRHAFQVRPGRFVQVAVSDTGIGMDEATRSRVFEPFFTTKETGRGAGLGLASAYGIIKNHGGLITVYSEKNSGSTFRFCLPASSKAVEAPREAAEGIRGGSETVLLIDDEEMIVEVGRQMLLNLGYQVLTAASGVRALEVFRKNRDIIQLVILDMIMPHMGGGQVFAALQEIDPGVRVLLSSGYSVNGQAMEILRAGCRGFIQKPFSIQDLARKIREVLGA